jgi:hypothetical protein
MQSRPAHTYAGAGRKIGLHGHTIPAETDSAERQSGSARYVDTKRSRCGQAIGHDAFAAGFVDRGNGAIRDGHVEAARANSDSGGETRRSAAADENVSRSGKQAQCDPESI